MASRSITGRSYVLSDQLCYMTEKGDRVSASQLMHCIILLSFICGIIAILLFVTHSSMQSPEKCPIFLRLSNLHHKPSSSKTSKLAKVFQLYIGYFSEALTVNRLCLSQSMSHNMTTLLKLDCRYKFQNLPQIRHKEQNCPPAQSRGAVTFSGLWFNVFTVEVVSVH